MTLFLAVIAAIVGGIWLLQGIRLIGWFLLQVLRGE